MAVLLAAAGAMAQGTFQGEAAQTKRAAELREQPGETSRSLASLAPQSPVTRLGERRGAWVQVRSSAGATGWLHMFDVGPAGGAASTTVSAPGGNAATGALRSVTSLFNKGGTSYQPTTVSTSTIGIRGLGAEDLASAQPNMGAVSQMEQLRASEPQARDFAARAPLAPVNVEPLPAPARAAGPQGDPSNPQMP
jgi:hypothetical protein